MRRLRPGAAARRAGFALWYLLAVFAALAIPAIAWESSFRRAVVATAHGTDRARARAVAAAGWEWARVRLARGQSPATDRAPGGRVRVLDGDVVVTLEPRGTGRYLCRVAGRVDGADGRPVTSELELEVGLAAGQDGERRVIVLRRLERGA